MKRIFINTDGTLKRIFLNADKAGALLGISGRQFRRKYVETGRIRAVTFKAFSCSGKGGIRKVVHRFLRTDVEALRK